MSRCVGLGLSACCGGCVNALSQVLQCFVMASSMPCDRFVNAFLLREDHQSFKYECGLLTTYAWEELLV